MQTWTTMATLTITSEESLFSNDAHVEERARRERGLDSRWQILFWPEDVCPWMFDGTTQYALIFVLINWIFLLFLFFFIHSLVFPDLCIKKIPMRAFMWNNRNKQVPFPQRSKDQIQKVCFLQLSMRISKDIFLNPNDPRWPRTLHLSFNYTHESSGALVKMQILTQHLWGWTWGLASLINS